ncbi:hypothetical protein INT44_000277 [Umbelopsis vinacea]|uniref:PH domain-containing protein n=1 Tax=Umbelopsis vinacea TaxID=44442 RepID=A0A8H7PKH0_9FUNG|nr:hypothetical protein INT44_000277 [Umbelopsis vinacea]
MGSAISTHRTDTLAQKANESFDECELFRGRLQLRTETGQWKKYDIVFDGSQITCPLWTIPIGDILVISTLKCKNQLSSQCLCLRTIHDDTILLRGKNPEDIERWAFVLQKICSLTKTAKEYKMMLARKQKSSKDNSVLAAKQYANTVNGSTPQRQRSRSTKARTRAERRAEQEQTAATIMLTEEKSEWINTWRQSLTDVEMEMLVPDLTSLPDDDERLSTTSGMTSISMRGRNHALKLAQAAAKTNEKAAEAATLKGFKSLPNLRPKSSSRALVTERRRGTSDHPNNRTTQQLPESQRAESHPEKLNILLDPQPELKPPDANDDASTVESAPPRTPSRHQSSPLHKQASESMPMIRYATQALSESPSYPNRHYVKQPIPRYAQSDMI